MKKNVKKGNVKQKKINLFIYIPKQVEDNQT